MTSRIGPPSAAIREALSERVIDRESYKGEFLFKVIAQTFPTDVSTFRRVCKKWAYFVDNSIRAGDAKCALIAGLPRKPYTGTSVDLYRKNNSSEAFSLLNPLFPDFSKFLFYVGNHDLKTPLDMPSFCGKTHYGQSIIRSYQYPKRVEELEEEKKDSIDVVRDEECAQYGVRLYQHRTAHRYYLEGDYQKALTYYEMAITGGDRDVDTLLKLCTFYGAGIGTLRNPEKAAYYFSILIKTPMASCDYYSLGICYQKGYGCGKDLDKAEEYFLKSKSKKGYIGCGDVYAERGDIQKAFTYYRCATSYNAPIEALIKICRLNLRLPVLYSKSLFYLPLSHIPYPADLRAFIGSWHAHQSRCYNDGIFIEKDVKRAEQEYRIAAECGHARAQFDLCKFYHKKGNKEKASKYFKLLIDPNHPECIWIEERYQMIGECLAKGMGTAQNASEAEYYDRLAGA